MNATPIWIRRVMAIRFAVSGRSTAQSHEEKSNFVDTPAFQAAADMLVEVFTTFFTTFTKGQGRTRKKLHYSGIYILA
jgi:hypothetical protein